MNKYISNVKDRVYSQVSDLISKSNTCTVDMVNCIDNINTDIKTIIDKVTVMGDMVTDLRVLNGTAKNITDITDLPIVSNTGLSLKNGNVGLSLYSQTTKEVNAKDAVIVSTLPYTLYDINNVSTDLDLLFKSNTSTCVAFTTSGYTFTISLPFSSIEQINSIDIKLNLNTETYPIINSIKYVDQNNTIQDTPILDTQNKSIDLDENRVVDNLYNININPVVTNQLLIEFVCKSGNTVTFDSIKPKYNKRTTSGSIVLGPYASNEPILKLAIDSDTITTGVSLYISGDKENWLPIINSSSFGSNKKILSFNTVSNNSQKLSEDLYRVYVKIDITSDKITNETSIVEVYDTYREDGVLNTDIVSNIPDNLLSAYRLKSSDYFYGKYSYNSSCNMADLSFKMIEQIDVEGIPKVVGMETTKYSISNNYDSSLGIAAVGCELRSLRLPSNGVVDARGFDVANSKLVDIYPRYIKQSVNVNQKNNLCFTLNVKEDLYTLISFTTRKSVVIDLTTPFIRNSSSALLQVPNEDIIIRDSLGKNILTITKDKLLNIDDIYFINLVGILFTPLIIEGLEYSASYPIKQLQDNEYALQDGKIIAASGVIFNVQGYELLKTEVTCNRVVNYTNGNYIKRVDDSYAYHYEQELDIPEPITVLKLNNVSIAKGSLVIEDLSQRQGAYINYKITNLNFERVDRNKPYSVVVGVSDNTVLNSDCYIQLSSNKDSAVIKDLGNLKYTVSNPTDTIITASVIYKGDKISSKSIKLEGIVGWGNTGFLDNTTYGQNSISCADAKDNYFGKFFGEGAVYGTHISSILTVSSVDEYGNSLGKLIESDYIGLKFEDAPVKYDGVDIMSTSDKYNITKLSNGIDLVRTSWIVSDDFQIFSYFINTSDSNQRLRIQVKHTNPEYQGGIEGFADKDQDIYICLAPKSSSAIFYDENQVNCDLNSNYGGCSLHRDLAYYTNINDTKSFYLKLTNSSNVNNDNETITSTTFEKLFDGNVLTLLSDLDSVKKLKDIGISFSVTEVDNNFGTHRVLVSYDQQPYLFQTTRIDIAQDNVMEITYYENENDHYLGDGNNDGSRKISADKKNISFCMCYNGKS